ncbi:ABC transporter permease [Natrarchaeobius halalkaliphilus]|uniref:ABC transporter permease n=1 Tax=Natrarchaeobius halalkaliphilus TaxID=1679091 RepID=A0A3N6LK25_9EURY|nr:ABC transporter permease [Natrarchaeobius halalkaliphilus]RQG86718.1 ABC transporter permease [Natrarchaeobius halalkaliphilus]
MTETTSTDSDRSPLFGSTGRLTTVGSRTRDTLVNYAPVLALFVAWELAGIVNALPYYLPAPSVIVQEIFELLQDGVLVPNASASLQLVYVGFFGGAALGILSGLVTGRVDTLGKLFDPLISITYPIPKIALFPIFLIWFGLGFTSKVVVVFLAAFYPTYIYTYDGAKGVNDLYIWSARNFNASRTRVFLTVVLPSCLPQILSGLRVSLALAFVVIFSVELIASQIGLGSLIVSAQQSNNFELMFASIAVIGTLGFVHDRALLLVRNRILSWNSGGEE